MRMINCHITIYHPHANPNLTLLISKVSEAIMPNAYNNHIGEGATLDEFILKQKGIRFIINGGFSHYRKHFYNWPHQEFNIGDPVGIVKIREHIFQDYINLKHYGFFIQKTKESIWSIHNKDHLNLQDKYILGCTPLLIFNQQSLNIPTSLMFPVPENTINPPSVLGHGLQNHPRTAVGLKNNNIYFITIEGNNSQYIGCNLLDLQNFGQFLELDSLLNLDGGGSSQFKLLYNHNYITNIIADEDKSRILGHVLVLFDESIK